MGYDSTFTGAFKCSPALTAAQVAYLTAFGETRRMRWDASKAAQRADPLREAVGLPLGAEACYFVGGDGYHGQVHTADVVNYNAPPAGQPGLWCQWVPTEDGASIKWDENEKFYCYIEWLLYIIDHFLRPWGVRLNGIVSWRGEDHGDTGRIIVRDNLVGVNEHPAAPVTEPLPTALEMLRTIADSTAVLNHLPVEHVQTIQALVDSEPNTVRLLARALIHGLWSIPVSPEMLAEIEAAAQRSGVSRSAFMTRLLQYGLESERERRDQFTHKMKQYRESPNPEEAERLSNEIGEMIFGQ